MLQYYLRAEGLALSWVGTGRLIFSLNYTDADFAAVADRFVAAAKAMEQDGWWWTIRRTTNKIDQAPHPAEMIAHRWSLARGRKQAIPSRHPNSPGIPMTFARCALIEIAGTVRR